MLFIPTKEVDLHSSQILCKNGASYFFPEADIYLDSTVYFWQKDLKFLDKDNEEKAKLICDTGESRTSDQPNPFLSNYENSAKSLYRNLREIKNKSTRFKNLSDQNLADLLYIKYYSSIPKNNYYTIIGLNTQNNGGSDFRAAIIYKKNWNWLTILSAWIGAIFFVYSMLNIIKETIVYIVFGQKFTWHWLIHPIKK